jgi:hypothetical protein
MANPELINFGYAIVQEDFKRLKRIDSLEEDIDTAFKITNEAWMEHGVCIDENRHIYSDGEIRCYKKRIPITSTSTSPAHGLRLRLPRKKTAGRDDRRARGHVPFRTFSPVRRCKSCSARFS